jgi:uncharacterized protein YjbJ (UPF0337 family)
MDRDRQEGVFKKTVGKIKEKAGELMGDRKTEARGKGEQVEGEAQETWGKTKDTVREKVGKD